MFCLAVQNPRSQNECSQHHKGSLDPESGILDPLEVICSKTEAWGSSFRIPVQLQVHYHRELILSLSRESTDYTVSRDPTGEQDFLKHSEKYGALDATGPVVAMANYVQML